jgi:diacylglycerol O-acyltransferase-1
MASSYHTAATTGADIAHAIASTLGQANGVVKTTQEAPTPPSEGGRHQTRLQKKYRHVAALHSKVQPSCLSHESETVPSFLGFRNLMVLVLSEHLFSLRLNTLAC